MANKNKPIKLKSDLFMCQKGATKDDYDMGYDADMLMPYNESIAKVVNKTASAEDIRRVKSLCEGEYSYWAKDIMALVKASFDA